MFRWVLVLTLLLGASACSTDTEPPLSRAAFADIVQATDDANWELVRSGVSRPEVTPGETLTEADWIATAELCLNNSGFDVTVSPNRFSYRSGNGQNQSSWEVARYYCTSLHPRVSDLVGYLDEVQRAHLYRYYAKSLVPCLQLAGAAPGPLPTQTEFMDDARFDPLGDVTTTGKARAVLLQKCPPVPGWLTY